jgi:hypothetical protein
MTFGTTAIEDTIFLSSVYTGVNNVGNFAMSPNGVFIVIRERRITLSVPFETTTIQPNPMFFNISVGNVRGIWIDKSGLRMFTADDNPAILNSYSLDTPWAVDTMTFLRAFSEPCMDVKFSDDGLKMFLTSFSKIKEYVLSTAWDTSTAILNFTLQNILLTYSICFSNEGKYLYTQNGDRVRTFFSPIPFNLDTFILIKDRILPIPPSNFEGLNISPNGMYFYFSRYNANPNLNQFRLTKQNIVG